MNQDTVINYRFKHSYKAHPQMLGPDMEALGNTVHTSKQVHMIDKKVISQNMNEAIWNVKAYVHIN
jgi:hypothetical protein